MVLYNILRSYVKKGEAPLIKFRVCQSTKKIMATIFWDCEGISAGFRINSPLGNILVRPSEQNKRITEINENHL
jgi:hypothetical protein